MLCKLGNINGGIDWCTFIPRFWKYAKMMIWWLKVMVFDAIVRKVEWSDSWVDWWVKSGGVLIHYYNLIKKYKKW